MALGKKFGIKLHKGKGGFATGLSRSMSFEQTSEVCDVGLSRSRSFGKGSEGFGLGLVRSTSFGRKRVSFTMDDIMEVESLNSPESLPNKKQCGAANSSFSTSEKSALESFPQDILTKILCGVDHDDLKSLFHVCKSFREATLIVKQCHFAYSTPKKRLQIRNAIEDVEKLNDLNEDEAAGLAPKQSRVPRSRISKKILAGISVALFTSEGENWPRKGGLFMDMETE